MELIKKGSLYKKFIKVFSFSLVFTIFYLQVLMNEYIKFVAFKCCFFYFSLFFSLIIQAHTVSDIHILKLFHVLPKSVPFLYLYELSLNYYLAFSFWYLFLTHFMFFVNLFLFIRF